MATFEELVEKAAKALRDHIEFNEIEVTEGDIKVRLVRFSPMYSSPMPLSYDYTYPGMNPERLLFSSS